MSSSVAEQAVAAVRQPVTVDLEPVAQPRLHDSLAALDLVDQPHHVGHQIGVDAGEVLGDDGAQQQPTEPGRRVDRQHQVAERDPTGRHRRPGVEDLELGEQHQPSTVHTYGRHTVRNSSAAAR